MVFSDTIVYENHVRLACQHHRFQSIGTCQAGQEDGVLSTYEPSSIKQSTSQTTNSIVTIQTISK